VLGHDRQISRAVRILVGATAALALADLSIVALALPPIMVELDASVVSVAAVLAVYAAVLGLVLLLAGRRLRASSLRAATAGGAIAFGLAGIVCAAAPNLPILFAARVLQAGAAGVVLVAASRFVVASRRATALWPLLAVVALTAGPALGGTLTDTVSWRAIFVIQAPVAFLAAVLVLLERPEIAAKAEPVRPRNRPPQRPMLALALVSAGASTSLFLFVLVVVAGWSVSPMRAAAALTVLPAFAVVGAWIRGSPEIRAAAGSILVASGSAALAFLPDASLAWTLLPQSLVGLGMGMAVPVLMGELGGERDARGATRSLAVTHLSVAFALVALAPLVAADLESETERAKLEGIALLLDAQIDPIRKLELAPRVFSAVRAEQPRAALAREAERSRSSIAPNERPAYDRLRARADDVLVAAVTDAFSRAFVIAACLALAAAVLLNRRTRPSPSLVAAAAVGILAVGFQAAAHVRSAPDRVTLGDPCAGERPDTGEGVARTIERRVMETLDRAACGFGSSREELVLALANDEAADRFRERHGVDPRNAVRLALAFL
jgi:MFS family permease